MSEEPTPTRRVSNQAVAGECRAAARRLGVVRHERNHLAALLSETDRHEAVVRSIGVEPVFEFKFADADRRGLVWFAARYVSPMGDSHYAGFIGGPMTAPQLECDTHGNSVSADALDKGVRSTTPIFEAITNLRLSARVPSSMERLRLAPDDLQIVVDLVQGALLALSDHLIGVSTPRENPGATAEALRLDTDALDALQMLWKQRALGESQAVSVKRVAATAMPRRPKRKGPSTYVKAAERGIEQLRSAGLAHARQNVGTWLSEAGVRKARHEFGSGGGAGRNPTR